MLQKLLWLVGIQQYRNFRRGEMKRRVIFGLLPVSRMGLPMMAFWLWRHRGEVKGLLQSAKGKVQARRGEGRFNSHDLHP